MLTIVMAERLAADCREIDKLQARIMDCELKKTALDEIISDCKAQINAIVNKTN